MRYRYAKLLLRSTSPISLSTLFNQVPIHITFPHVFSFKSHIQIKSFILLSPFVSLLASGKLLSCVT